MTLHGPSRVYSYSCTCLKYECNFHCGRRRARGAGSARWGRGLHAHKRMLLTPASHRLPLDYIIGDAQQNEAKTGGRRCEARAHQCGKVPQSARRGASRGSRTCTTQCAPAPAETMQIPSHRAPLSPKARIAPVLARYPPRGARAFWGAHRGGGPWGGVRALARSPAARGPSGELLTGNLDALATPPGLPVQPVVLQRRFMHSCLRARNRGTSTSQHAARGSGGPQSPWACVQECWTATGTPSSAI